MPETTNLNDDGIVGSVTPDPFGQRAQAMDGDRALELGYYRPTERFRAMSEHICVMDTGPAATQRAYRSGVGDGDLIAIFGPSRAAGSTTQEVTASKRDARYFMAAFAMAEALRWYANPDNFEDFVDTSVRNDGSINGYSVDGEGISERARAILQMLQLEDSEAIDA